MRVSIVRHRREQRRSCSLTPLEGREGFEFYRYPNLRRPADAFRDHLRLAFDGPPLRRSERDRPLLLLDATWKRVGAMERTFAGVAARSLPACDTAYPRRSKLVPDPRRGLASIEALIVAASVLGYDRGPLVDAYPWAAEFAARNPALFRLVREPSVARDG